MADLEPPPPGCHVAADRSVTFAHRSAEARSVVVAGDFTAWSQAPIAMRRVDGSDLWVARTGPLPAGLHVYKYIVDDRWTADPANPLDVDDGIGGRNSAFVAGARTLPGDGAIRIASLNLHTWQQKNARQKLEHIALGAAAMDVDLLLLQEVGQHVSDPARPNAGSVLADHLQRFTRKNWHHEWREAHIGFDVYHEGLSILSSSPLRDVTLHRLSEGFCARIALVATTTLKGAALRVGTTHVAWGQEGDREVKLLLDELDKRPAKGTVATLIAGDFNAGPTEPQVGHFVRRGYVEVGTSLGTVAPTFGEPELSERIDYHFVRTAAGHPPPRLEAFVRIFDGVSPGFHPRVSDHAGLLGAYRWNVT
jgi:endonuclease/exonuclease/phosphatase family metal-dependent hydrolase